MPETHNDGLTLYYETGGAGEALVLLTGLGGSGEAWSRQRSVFEQNYMVLTPDPRGSGRSGIPTWDYTTVDMAQDTIAVLDHAGITSAHVLGIGLGGLVAQQMALRHPHRVDSLVLFSTFAKADAHAQRLFESWCELLPIIGWEALGRSISLWTLTPRMFEDRPKEVEQVEEGFRSGQPSPEAYAGQVRALLAHDTSQDLAQVRVPTLVVLGADDIETPMRFARVLAEGIPKAELRVLAETGHRPHVETPTLFNEAVLEFLRSHATSDYDSHKEGGSP